MAWGAELARTAPLPVKLIAIGLVSLQVGLCLAFWLPISPFTIIPVIAPFIGAFGCFIAAFVKGVIES